MGRPRKNKGLPSNLLKEIDAARVVIGELQSVFIIKDSLFEE